MGGLGSGQRTSRKCTVEECLFIDIGLILRLGIYDEGRIPVFVKISAAFWKKQVAFINYTFEYEDGSLPFLNLKYKVRKDDEKKEVAEPVALQRTKLCSGGVR